MTDVIFLSSGKHGVAIPPVATWKFDALQMTTVFPKILIPVSIILAKIRKMEHQILADISPMVAAK
jgi:hypothetical protein